MAAKGYYVGCIELYCNSGRTAKEAIDLYFGKSVIKKKVRKPEAFKTFVSEICAGFRTPANTVCLTSVRTKAAIPLAEKKMLEQARKMRKR